MTTDTPSPDVDIHSTREADYLRFKHYAALTFLIASPVLIALPPRKLDHLTYRRAHRGTNFFHPVTGHIRSPEPAGAGGPGETACGAGSADP
ncbi:hypothetical protein CNMCM5878_005432 [Aspergillus fumigatiaffinis]|nr:hypothetical protein CNMCM5878_005432 [Aspergillus fumigatiaffinis]